MVSGSTSVLRSAVTSPSGVITSMRAPWFEQGTLLAVALGLNAGAHGSNGMLARVRSKSGP